MSSKRATITITTKESPIDVSANVEVGGPMMQNSIEGMVTTTLITVRDNFTPSGAKEEPGIAVGKVTLHNETGADQSLVATTRLLAPNEILFHLKDKVVVPARGSVEAEVYADKAGASGNIGPTDRFTIPGLAGTSKHKLIYGKSTTPMTGGTKKVGSVTVIDLEKAENTLLEKAVSEAKSLFSVKELGQEAVFGKIGQPSLKSSVEAGQAADTYSVELSVKMAVIFYNSEDLRVYAENLLKQRAIDDSEIIEKGGQPPVVVLEKYDEKESDRATLSFTYGGKATLNRDSDQLQKMMFFGKTKDEVRKYLLSLKHVHSADVEFSPGWIMTVPHVPDHVNIIVKSVR